MPILKDPTAAKAPVDSSAIEVAIRIALLALLIYCALKVIGPFLTVGLWSAILGVALYPLFSWLARQIGSRRLAAWVLTLASLLIVIGPATWLGFGLIQGVQLMVQGLDAQTAVIPEPAESVKHWPLIGDQVYELWMRGASDTKAILRELAPTLKPLGSRLVGVAGTVAFGLLELVASIIIAGFLYSPGPRLTAALGALLRRIFGERSEQMLTLTRDIIRNVSRGVIGISLGQALLAGLGFLAAGAPAPALLTFIALVLGIVQIGPSILILATIIWAWTSLATTQALLYTLYMIPVSLIDNVSKPFVMARGLKTPMPVILVGVIGGTIAYGISGVFVGPVVLAVAWALLTAWVQQDTAESGAVRSD